MIKETQGNVLTLERGIIVHGCNCHGVMGSGIAKQIRDKWVAVYEAYRQRHAKFGLRLGDTIAVGHHQWRKNKDAVRHLETVDAALPEDVVVVNAMTQVDFGNDPEVVYVDYDGLEAAFSRIRLLARDTGLPVHFPLIGCGLANGKWDEVSKRIDRALGPDVEKTLWHFVP